MNSKTPAKRVNILSLKVVKESSILYQNRKVSSPHDAQLLIEPLLLDCDREKFLIACLNTKNEPIGISTISVGSLNASLVHPREVYKIAILSNAASIILCHNHPSGDPTPSEEDKRITTRLLDAGDILGIKVIDHIIIGEKDRYFSFKENSIL